ncbi:MAG: low molecular weight protein arginine phosphatase [Dethiobacter sp.]|nr:low molecular weight protein arginine phosphatase [Dethiobacter sp.]
MILFVCTGNTCRSVMAEELLRRDWQLRGGNPKLEITSAGLAANPGERASRHVKALLAEKGIDTTAHSATPLDAALVKSAGLILVMTSNHRESLLARFPEAASKTFLLKEFAGIVGNNPDITDPYGASLGKYRRIMEEIHDCISKFIVNLKGECFDEGGVGQ